MTPSGSIAPALLHIRAALAAALEPFGWTVSTADNPFRKFNALYAVGAGGVCVVSWNGDRKLDQAGRSLVIRASIAVSLASKKDVVKPALGKLLGDQPRLFEIHDRVKGAMLSLSMPAGTVPEPGADVAGYAGSRPLAGPDGMPMDGIEQIWEVELLESFGPN